MICSCLVKTLPLITLQVKSTLSRTLQNFVINITALESAPHATDEYSQLKKIRFHSEPSDKREKGTGVVVHR